MSQQERRKRVAEMHAQGASNGEMAKSLQVTLSTVSRDLAALGLRSLHAATKFGIEYRAQMAPQIKTLADQGLSANQISLQLGMGYDTLLKVAREHEIIFAEAKVGRPTRRNLLWPQVEKMWVEGSSAMDICRALHLNYSTLASWFRAEGVAMERRQNYENQAKHFGTTAEDRAETARRGGQAGKQNQVTAVCEYCEKTFTRPYGNARTGRQRFCSTEHAAAYRRERSGKTTTYTCEYCGEEFDGWTSTPRKYCTQAHYLRATKKVSNYVVQDQDMVLKGYEVAFLGLCQIMGIPCGQFDRSQVIEVEIDGKKRVYGPDFVVTLDDGPLWVDPKGRVHQYAEEKWAAFRAQRGRLAIVFKEDLERLRVLDKAAFVADLRALAAL